MSEEVEMSDVDRGFSDEKLLDIETKKNQMQNLRLGSSQVDIFGDKLVMIQLVKLLAYIRNAIKSGQKKEITLKIGEKLANAEFNFTVNDQSIDDLIAQDEVIIS